MAQSPRSFPQGFIMPYLPHRGEQARAPRRICRLRRQTGSGTSCRIFCPTGRKQAPSTQIDARSCIPYPPHFLPYRQKTGASVADFRVRRREIILIVISNDMRVGNDSSQAASVEFARRRRANYACSGLQSPSKMKGNGFAVPFHFRICTILSPPVPSSSRRPGGSSRR